MLGSEYNSDRCVGAVLRKAELCGCGCHGLVALLAGALLPLLLRVLLLLLLLLLLLQGLHSVQPIEWALAVSLFYASLGVWPTARHDGLPWMDKRDDARASQSGALLLNGFRACFMGYTGDLLQFVDGTGCPHYSSTHSPCAFCHATQKEALNDLKTVFPARTPREYREHQQKSLVRVRFSQNNVRAVLPFLRCSKKRRGRAVVKPRQSTPAWRVVLHGFLMGPGWGIAQGQS